MRCLVEGRGGSADAAKAPPVAGEQNPVAWETPVKIATRAAIGSDAVASLDSKP